MKRARPIEIRIVAEGTRCLNPAFDITPGGFGDRADHRARRLFGRPGRQSRGCFDR